MSCPQCGAAVAFCMESFPAQYECANGHGWERVDEHMSVGNLKADDPALVCPQCKHAAKTRWYTDNAEYFSCSKRHAWQRQETMK